MSDKKSVNDRTHDVTGVYKDIIRIDQVSMNWVGLSKVITQL